MKVLRIIWKFIDGLWTFGLDVPCSWVMDKLTRPVPLDGSDEEAAGDVIGRAIFVALMAILFALVIWFVIKAHFNI
jgi:hypothetical protein